MIEKRQEQLNEKFKRFFADFARRHSHDKDLRPDKMLESAIRAFEIIHGPGSLTLDESEKRALAGHVEPSAAEEAGTGPLEQEVAELREGLDRLEHDYLRLRQWSVRVLDLLGRAKEQLGEGHHLTVAVVELQKKVAEELDALEKAGEAIAFPDESARHGGETVMYWTGEQPPSAEPESQGPPESFETMEREAPAEPLPVEFVGDLSEISTHGEEPEAAPDAERVQRLQEELRRLQDELAAAFVRRQEKSGLFGRLFGAKSKAEADYERLWQEYVRVRKELALETEKSAEAIMRFLQAQERGLRSQIKEGYKSKENFLSRAWRWLGDQNIYALFERKAKENPESWWAREFSKWGAAGRIGGKMLSLRFGISMGLAGIGIHGPGMADTAGYAVARSGFVGLGSGFGSRALMDISGRWLGAGKLKIFGSREDAEQAFRQAKSGKATDKQVRKWVEKKVKYLDDLGDNPQAQYRELSSTIGEYEGWAVVNQVDLSKDENYQRLLLLRDELAKKLLEKDLASDSRDKVAIEDAEIAMKFLEEKESESLSLLSREIGGAKAKRWVKRVASVAVGASVGIFTHWLLSARAAYHKLSEEYFDWQESRQRAVEAVQEAQATHAQTVAQAGTAPSAPQEFGTEATPSGVEAPAEYIPRAESGPTAVETAAVSKFAVAAEAPRFEIDANNAEFRVLAANLRLSQAGMDYMEKLTAKFPQLKEADVLERVWRAGELGDHSGFNHPGIYDAVKNFDTHIKTAGAFKFEVFQAVLDKAGVDEATEYLKLFGFNEHSLTNLGIADADKYFVRVHGRWELTSDKALQQELFDKMRGVVRDYHKGDTAQGRHIFNALRHHQNRFIGDQQLPVRGVEKGAPVRVVGANEFSGDRRIMVEQARGVRAVRLAVEQAPVKPALAVEAIKPEDIGITESTPVRVEGGLPEGLEADKVSSKNLIEITPVEGGQKAVVVLDDGRVFMADFEATPASDASAPAEVLLSHFQPIGGETDLLEGLGDKDLAKMAELYPGASKAELAKSVISGARGAGHYVSGGVGERAAEIRTPSGGGVGRVLITPEVAPSKPVASAGSPAASEHVSPRVEKAVAREDIEPLESRVALESTPRQAGRATPETADEDVAKIYEQPAGAQTEFLPDTASFNDIASAIDDSNWKGVDQNQALTCLRMLEMQNGLTKNGANNLQELLTENGIADGDTQAEANWKQHIVSLLNQKQGDSLRVLREGLNKGTGWAEIKKDLAREMFLYDLAAQQPSSSAIEGTDQDILLYNRWVVQKAQEWYDNSDVEADIAREKVGLSGGGTASK